MAAIRFLTSARVIEIHHDQIARYGGDDSIRDPALLDSAVAMPEASFGGQYVHAFPHGMAAAYLFHIISNHPFGDGNKRTGLASSLLFLQRNKISVNGWNHKAMEECTLAVARGEMAKEQVTEFFRSHIR